MTRFTKLRVFGVIVPVKQRFACELQGCTDATGTVFYGAYSVDGHPQIRISDNGAGMSQDDAGPAVARARSMFAPDSDANGWGIIFCQTDHAIVWR